MLSECSLAIWSERLNDSSTKSHSFRMLVPRKVADSYCFKNNNKKCYCLKNIFILFFKKYGGSGLVRQQSKGQALLLFQ